MTKSRYKSSVSRNTDTSFFSTFIGSPSPRSADSNGIPGIESLLFPCGDDDDDSSTNSERINAPMDTTPSMEGIKK